MGTSGGKGFKLALKSITSFPVSSLYRFPIPPCMAFPGSSSDTIFAFFCGIMLNIGP